MPAAGRPRAVGDPHAAELLELERVDAVLELVAALIVLEVVDVEEVGLPVLILRGGEIDDSAGAELERLLGHVTRAVDVLAADADGLTRAELRRRIRLPLEVSVRDQL